MPNFKLSPLTVSVVAACLLALGGALVFSGASRAADEPQAGQPRPGEQRWPGVDAMRVLQRGSGGEHPDPVATELARQRAPLRHRRQHLDGSRGRQRGPPCRGAAQEG